MKNVKIKGVSFLTDGNNRRQAVVIDIKTLERHPEDVDDLLDAIIAESRKSEPKKSWESVKKKLSSKK